MPGAWAARPTLPVSATQSSRSRAGGSLIQGGGGIARSLSHAGQVLQAEAGGAHRDPQDQPEQQGSRAGPANGGHVGGEPDRGERDRDAQQREPVQERLQVI